MNQVQAEISQVDFIQQQCPVPGSDKEALNQALQGSLCGIATYIKLSNGQYWVLSRYEDDVWEFSASEFAAGTEKGGCKLDFTAIGDINARAIAKWIIWSKRASGIKPSSLNSNLLNLKLFFSWLSKSDTLSADGLTAWTARCYVAHAKSLKVKRKGELTHLGPKTLSKRFAAVQDIYTYGRSFGFVKEHPWVGSTANEQAGYVGAVRLETETKAATPIIPAETLKALSLFTKGFFDRADELLDIRGKLRAFISAGNSSNYRERQVRKYLQSLDVGFDTLGDLNEALLLLRDSCIFWILLTTGMRIHEVQGIERRAYRTETKDGETYYYIQSRSEKTYEGLTEWIAPKIAVDAIDILERYSSDLQARVERQLATAIERGDHQEVNRLQSITGKVSLASDGTTVGSGVSVLSPKNITTRRLPNLCAQIGSDWDLSAHQFRRTFANHVAHSELGDLRALKEHFKHWSGGMTALYASNDKLDQELFEDLLREQHWAEEQIKFDWFELDKPITGSPNGIASNIMKVRGDKDHIKMFKTHKDMVKSYSAGVSIKGTGIGFCTNDKECVGGMCDECDYGIIDTTHIPHWEGVLVQQINLSALTDIGEAGQAAVAGGMARAEKVLGALGVDVNKIKLENSNNNQAL